MEIIFSEKTLSNANNLRVLHVAGKDITDPYIYQYEKVPLKKPKDKDIIKEFLHSYKNCYTCGAEVTSSNTKVYRGIITNCPLFIACKDCVDKYTKYDFACFQQYCDTNNNYCANLDRTKGGCTHGDLFFPLVDPKDPHPEHADYMVYRRLEDLNLYD